MYVISFQRETKAYQGKVVRMVLVNPDFDSSITKEYE
jgi:hypothetical protein